jgi:proteasome lid subunit RPN8/RPN11
MMVEANTGPVVSGEIVLPLEIPADLFDVMIAHCRRDAPLECCGILGGVQPRVLSLHPLCNIAASKTRYLADPKELIQAYVWLRSQQRDILAIYHSHPASFEELSWTLVEPTGELAEALQPTPPPD